MKKKRLLMAFCMLLLSGVALSTATYAWFTANTKLQLGEFDVKVQASEGIQVSVDARNWKATLETDEIKAGAYTGSTNQFPTTLEPVSTIGSTTAGIFDMFYGKLEEDSSITLTKETDAQGTEGKYVAFDLFISSSATTDQEIQLLSTSSVKVNGETDAGLKYSARVGFLNKGTDNTNTPAKAYLLNNSVSSTIWEPNSDQHTDVVINSNLAAAGDQLTYKGAKAIGTKVAIDNTTNFGDITATKVITKETETTQSWPNTTIFTVSQGITKVRVYIWIEGQDIDCENSASLGSGIAVNLAFNVKTAA